MHQAEQDRGKHAVNAAEAQARELFRHLELNNELHFGAVPGQPCLRLEPVGMVPVEVDIIKWIQPQSGLPDAGIGLPADFKVRVVGP